MKFIKLTLLLLIISTIFSCNDSDSDNPNLGGGGTASLQGVWNLDFIEFGGVVVSRDLDFDLVITQNIFAEGDDFDHTTEYFNDGRVQSMGTYTLYTTNTIDNESAMDTTFVQNELAEAEYTFDGMNLSTTNPIGIIGESTVTLLTENSLIIQATINDMDTIFNIISERNIDVEYRFIR